MAFNNIFKGKKVLITGNTGFKGCWLSTWLYLLGADVYGYSLSVPTHPSMFETLKLQDKLSQKYGDIRDLRDFRDYVMAIRPDFIFHLAAQALVLSSYRDPLNTISTNVLGTSIVCETIREIDWNCTCVLITSDKAYDNVEWIWGYREMDRLGGKDIYSGSKGAAELVIKSYWHSFIKNKQNIKLGITRAGNVIGGGDWAADRIVVDCIKAFSKGQTVEIRSPQATRPWQHVLEPLSGYLLLAQFLYEGKVTNGEPFNFGPRSEQTKTVLELVSDLARLWGLDVQRVIKIADDIPFNEATLLKLNCDKASIYLSWQPTLKYEECVQFISDWYKAFYSGKVVDMFELTRNQIDMYMNKAKELKIVWTE